MSRIINLRIKNYRCFKDFSAHFEERFVVLIGRGDSGKSSLLKAIEALLSPLWNYSFSDWDFYNGDIELSYPDRGRYCRFTKRTI